MRRRASIQLYDEREVRLREVVAELGGAIRHLHGVAIRAGEQGFERLDTQPALDTGQIAATSAGEREERRHQLQRGGESRGALTRARREDKAENGRRGGYGGRWRRRLGAGAARGGAIIRADGRTGRSGIEAAWQAYEVAPDGQRLGRDICRHGGAQGGARRRAHDEPGERVPSQREDRRERAPLDALRILQGDADCEQVGEACAQRPIVLAT
jgi:hypothetical protein